jgi:hypothetical protein
MKIQSQQKFIPTVWERLSDLPAYVELFVPGGFLLFVGGVLLVLVICFLCGGSSFLSVHAENGELPLVLRSASTQGFHVLTCGLIK